VIASGSPAQTQADPVVRTAYLGRSPGEGSETGPADGAAVSPLVIGGRHVRPAVRSSDVESVPMLRVSGVSAGYGGIDVITDVTFDVGEGEVFGLLGPNGSGKTTTLNVVAGLLRPTRGQVAFCGRSLAGADADALARAGVRMVPEGRGVFPNLSVAENLWMSSYTGTDRRTIEERAYSRFPRLAQRSRQTAGTLSGGEQQMLAMARALATDPAMLVLDELSMGLAPMVVADLYACVAELADGGVTVLVVEQFAHELLGVADRLAIMLSGRIVRVGEPAEIAAELEGAYLSGVASR
jgi:branched-chain amino acid transport system ATP-binding protein